MGKGSLTVRAGTAARGLHLIASLALLAAPVAWGAGPTGKELAPGILVVPERDSLFVMLPQGGMAELATDTGRERWRTTEAAKPLAVHGGRLLAQAEGRSSVLELRSFDLAALETASRRIDYALPAEAAAAVDEEMLLAFQVRAVVRGDALYVLWSYRRTLARMQPAYAERITTDLNGALRVDPVEGTVVSVDVASVPAEVAPPAQSAGTDDLVGPPRLAGDVLAGLALRGKPGGPRQAVLERWRAADGQPLGEVPLETSDVRRWVFSADDRHVLIGAAQRGVEPERQYAWTVYSMLGGERLVQIERPKSGAPYVVQGSTLLLMASPMRRREGNELLEIPARIEAVTLGGGDVAWSHEVRDTVYRGPYPKELPESRGGVARPVIGRPALRR